MKKQRREIRTRAGPLIFFLIYVIIGGIIGMTINSRDYAIERGEMNPRSSSQDDTYKPP